MQISNEDQNDLLAALAAELRDRQPRPGEFTIADLMEQTGMKKEMCKAFLREKVKAGILYQREIAGRRWVFGKKG